MGLQLAHLGLHIGINPVLVDVPTTGGEVFGDGHGHAGAIGETPHRLHQTFTKGLLTHQDGPLVVLKGTGENFTGTGGAFIDKHHQGLGRKGTTIGPLHVLDAVAGFGGDDRALIEPLAGDLHAGHQQAAGVAAQVQHIALGALLLQVLYRQAHVLGGGGIELAQADVAHLDAIWAGIDLMIYGVELDAFAGEGHLQALTLALQGEGYGGTSLAADQLDRIFGTHALGALAINRRDHILGLHAGPRSR